ncbi:hypothetical protein BU16DRAFT_335152 [Lophium mytilinum]|uniref:Uncharacterized protein n=1 Tax=Lophium mytilinum TaxID=390894 RepID=A0A6A6QXK1_9PEZI|nr:hypothetical protein BU16DRAFT_335152 [Lophium mytilinum]
MSASTPASASLTLLPHPVNSTVHTVGQLLASKEHIDTNSLADRHFDDTFFVPFYRDILTLKPDETLNSSLGGIRLLSAREASGSLVQLNAEKMEVRGLKDPQGALDLVAKSPSAQSWLKLRLAEGKEVVFVTKVQSVRNANWRRCSVVDVGNGMVRVREERRASRADEEAVDLGEGGLLKKVDSETGEELAVASPTGSKNDVLALEVRKVVLEEGDGGDVQCELGEALGQEEAAAFLK